MRIIALFLFLVQGIGILFGGQPLIPKATASLINAERSFAAAAGKDGIRKAFLTFLADDAVVFRPGPENGQSVWAKRKETSARLEWHPTVAFTCASGDLGYTSGPSIWTPEAQFDQPPSYGYFVSMWKKQKNGDWRVVLDIGTQTDAPSTPDTSMYVPASFSNVLSNSKVQKNNVLNAEKGFSKVASSAGIRAAFNKFLLEDGRVYRPGKFPVQGREAVVKAFEQDTSRVSSTVTHCTMANSGDLAYTYGSYTTAEPGYFVRIWRKVNRNDWKLAIEVISPIPIKQ